MTVAVIRVLLADDHPALRVGLRVLLDHERDVTVVGEVADGGLVLERVATLQPQVVVLDCQLPGLSGVAVASALKESAPTVLCVALSAYDDDRYLAGMLEGGARGYLLKSEAPGQIVAAVRSVMRGETLWTVEQTARAHRWLDQVARLCESLTQREREVLLLVAEGLSNKEIAQELTVTVRTADFHVSNILRKLEVISRVEAAVWAKEHLREDPVL